MVKETKRDRERESVKINTKPNVYWGFLCVLEDIDINKQTTRTEQTANVIEKNNNI